MNCALSQKVLTALAVGLIAVPAAFGEADITAFMRSLGDEAWSAEPYDNTKVYSTTPVRNIIDGVYATGSSEGRIMMERKTGGGMFLPCDVKCAFRPVNGTNFVATVTSFTLVRFSNHADYDYHRSPNRFVLYGSNDGFAWAKLYETAEDVLWERGGPVAQTFEIPHDVQRPYSQYRLSLDPSVCRAPEGPDSLIGIHELILNGDVRVASVWTGATGSAWNGTDANWSGAGGTWVSGHAAVFDESGANRTVTLDGDVTTGQLYVRGCADYSLLGGQLNLMAPFLVRSESGSTIASDIGTVAWTATSDQAEKLPNDGTWVKLWENRSLSDMTFTGARLSSKSYGAGTASAYWQRSEDGDVTAQFQCREDSTWPLLCVKARFRQIGSDVWATGEHAWFTWADTRQLGDDMEVKNQGENKSGWQIQSIVAEDSPHTMTFTVGSRGTESVLGKACLPPDASGSTTGRAVTCWPNRRLADLVGMKSIVFRDGGTHRAAATIEFWRHDGTTASFQAQCCRGSNADGRTPRLCVKVELTQDGPDIMARAVYAKYLWFAAGVDPVVTDFDPLGNNTKIYTEEEPNSGYGISCLMADFRSRLTLTGEVKTPRMAVEDGTLAFGAASLAFAHDVSGSGTLGFAPVSGAQTVTFTGTCACEGGLAIGDGTTFVLPAGTVRTAAKATFSGTSTLRLAEGATLSLGTVAFEPDAVVNLELPKGAETSSLRVGTTACLSREELMHFRVGGYSLRRQTDDGWINASVPGAILVFR